MGRVKSLTTLTNGHTVVFTLAPPLFLCAAADEACNVAALEAALLLAARALAPVCAAYRAE